MANRKYRYFAADFETTVYKGQVNTEVWASASVELFTEEVKIFHSIAEQFNYFKSLDCNVCAYYHNLKFDGSFWLSYLLIDLGLKQAYEQADTNNKDTISFLSPRDMPNNSFSYSISSMGQWYRITIKVNNHLIEFRDSYKLLPFTLRKIGKDFRTKHQKLEMEYKGFRYAGCPISAAEADYIGNDVLVLKEALEFMFTEGHNKLTIGSCCLSEYKRLIGDKVYKDLFPNLYEVPIDPDTYGACSAGEYIHNSYKGGWCYLVPEKAKQVKHIGFTADVNSLYPSMMSSESLNLYPVKYPTFWSGNFIPPEAEAPGKYFFIRIRTRFYIKENKLPTIQIKHDMLYKSNEWLRCSDVYDKNTGKYHPYLRDKNGEIRDTRVTLTLTQVDLRLMTEQYHFVDFEILDGCYFDSMIGIFDTYIDKYKKIKINSEGAMRQLAKLFLNNLYGKMASSPESSFKVAMIKPDKSLGFFQVDASDKEPGYIPVGSAITSYARNFTIRAAQANYYGADEPGFIYADTDSIHCDLPTSAIKGVRLHPKNFCCWDLESEWDTGLFIRQKTYIEHEVKHSGKEVEPNLNVKCAGMPDHCKELFKLSLKGIDGELTDSERKLLDEATEEEKEFLNCKRELSDFDVGLVVPGKLMPKRIRGGVLLVDTTYEMR